MEGDLDDDNADFELFEQEPEGATEVACPYCGALGEIMIDPYGGQDQRYVEDCAVCCQPWAVRVHVGPDGFAAVSLTTLDEG